MAIFCGTLLTPSLVIVTEMELAPDASHGNWKLTWLVETKNSGTAWPLIRNVTPLSDRGNGAAEALCVALARLMPNKEPIAPAATVCRKLAPFTIPPALMIGAAPVAA